MGITAISVLATAMLAKGRGAQYVVGVDTQKERISRGEELGVVDYGFLADEHTLENIRDITKRGASCAIDCSGNPQGRLLALQGCAEWGRTVYLGETGSVTFQVSDDLMHKQRTIIGSWVTSLYNMERCCNDLVAWDMHPDRIVEKEFPLSKAQEAYTLMASRKCGKIILNPGL